MQHDSIRTVSKGALSFFSGTFLSRITGMVRDMAMAFCFGSHPVIAAFMVAFRLANFFRRMVGEGPLPSGFIPYFESLRGQFPEEGARFFRDVLFSFFLALSGALLVCELALCLWFFYGSLSEASGEILFLTILMMPGVLFICLYGIFGALLQCEKKFFLPGFAPVLFNVTWIAAVFFFRDDLPERAVLGLSAAVVVGFFLQWALLLPEAGKYLLRFLSLKELFRFRFFPLEVKRVIKPFALGLTGIAATQVNSALDAGFARVASLEGPAYLWYSIRIEQLPLALFGIALASALLPPLAKALSQGNKDRFGELFSFAFNRGIAFIIPCTAALLVLACSGVNLLYGRGDFSQEATFRTVFCLWGYGIGLPPAVFVLLLAPLFYSGKNFKAPTRAAVWSVVCNVCLNALFVFVFRWDAFSIAVATGISAWLNFWLLWRVMRREYPFLPGLCEGLSKTIFCSLLAGTGVLFVGFLWAGDPTISLLFGKEASISREPMNQVMQVLFLSTTFFVFLLSSAWITDAKEILSLCKITKKKRSYEGDA